jgi:hypothetical protein
MCRRAAQLLHVCMGTCQVVFFITRDSTDSASCFTCTAVQVDLSALQQQLDTVRQAPEGADIAPSLDAIAELLGQPALPDAATAAARLVAEVAEGRQAAGAGACQQQHRAGTLFTLPQCPKAACVLTKG